MFEQAIAQKYFIEVGAAKIRVTPELGDSLRMSGFSGRDRPFQGVHDDLFLKAIVLYDGARYSAHFSSDQLSISAAQVRTVASILEEMNVPISRDMLFMSATHTHGGVSTSFSGHQPTIDYRRQRTQKMAEVIRAAYDRLEPVQMRMAKLAVAGVHNNRQEILSHECDLGVDPDGVSDKTLHLTRFLRPDGSTMASMLLFGVHATMLGQHNYYLTGDLPGAVTKHLESYWGPDHISLWMMSGGGDQSPTYYHQKTAAFNDPIRSPNGLAGFMIDAFLNDLTEYEEILSGVVLQPDVVSVQLQRKNGSMDTRQLYFLRLNSQAILVGTPFELFAQTVMDIEAASPFAHTLIYSLTNDKAYYLPTPESYEHKFTCYENSTGLFVRESEPHIKNTIIKKLLSISHEE